MEKTFEFIAKQAKTQMGRVRQESCKFSELVVGPGVQYCAEQLLDSCDGCDGNFEHK